jgi:hypothetical protein
MYRNTLFPDVKKKKRRLLRELHKGWIEVVPDSAYMVLIWRVGIEMIRCRIDHRN